jgi:hypothetical protein
MTYGNASRSDDYFWFFWRHGDDVLFFHRQDFLHAWNVQIDPQASERLEEKGMRKD